MLRLVVIETKKFKEGSDEPEEFEYIKQEVDCDEFENRRKKTVN